MRLMRPFLRFKLFDRKQDVWIVLPSDSIRMIASFPSYAKEGDTVTLYTENGEFEVEGNELDIIDKLGWKD